MTQELTPLAQAVQDKNGTPRDYALLKTILAHPLAAFLIRDEDNRKRVCQRIHEQLAESNLASYLGHFVETCLDLEDEINARISKAFTLEDICECFGLSPQWEQQIRDALACLDSNFAQSAPTLDDLKEYARAFSGELNPFGRIMGIQWNATILNGSEVSKGIGFHAEERSKDGEILITVDDQKCSLSFLSEQDNIYQERWRKAYHDAPPIIISYFTHIGIVERWRKAYHDAPPAQLQTATEIWIFAPAQMRYWTQSVARDQANTAIYRCLHEDTSSLTKEESCAKSDIG